MSGGTTTHIPANEAALVKAVDAAVKRVYGRRAYMVPTHRLTPVRRGIPDRLYIVDGRMFAFEFKNPRRPAAPTVGQAAELERLQAAGAVTAIILSADAALSIIGDACPNV